MTAIGDATLYLGDCLEKMPLIQDQSVDAIITDPPYPEIDRPYGRMTEAEWHAMMRGVVAESRRILKPTGSAVFILQPNFETPGRMRLWLWDFISWVGREWNLVQDAYWWNTSALPMTKNDPESLRCSVKACVWIGPIGCYKAASEVRWLPSQQSYAKASEDRALRYAVGGCSLRDRAMYAKAVENNGSTPFNLIPMRGYGDGSHPAATPEPLCDWWTRYISPEGGTVCDPFMGSGTTGLAALKRGRKFVGIERDAGYFATAQARLAAHLAEMPLLTG